MKNHKVIFVLDDDLCLRILMKHIIESFGYSVELYANPDEALKNFHDNVFLIFTDLNMQPFSDLQFLKNIRQFSKIPIVMISAQGELSEEIYAKALGVNCFLSKPFSRDQVLQEIKKYDLPHS